MQMGKNFDVAEIVGNLLPANILIFLP